MSKTEYQGVKAITQNSYLTPLQAICSAENIFNLHAALAGAIQTGDLEVTSIIYSHLTSKSKSIISSGESSSSLEIVTHEPILLLDTDHSKKLSPLFSAIFYGQPEIANYFLENGADPNEYNSDLNCSAVHFAVSYDVSILAELVKFEAGINIVDSLGRTCLHRALNFANLDMIKQMLDVKPDSQAVNGDGHTVLHLLVLDNNLELVELLLSQGAKPNDFGGIYCSALHLAVAYGMCKMVKLLAKYEADINLKSPAFAGKTPIEMAYESGDADMVNELEVLGVPIIEREDRSLDIKDQIDGFISSGNAGDLEKFLKYNNIPYNSLEKYFARAVNLDQLYIANIFIKSGGLNPNILDHQSGELLRCAIERENFEAVEFLLDSGADFAVGFRCFFATQHRKVALIKNVSAEKMKIFDLLTERKELSIKLHYAVQAQDLELVKQYLLEGARPNYVYARKTAMHIADMEGQNKIWHALIEAGGESNIVDVQRIDAARGLELIGTLLWNCMEDYGLVES